MVIMDICYWLVERDGESLPEIKRTDASSDAHIGDAAGGGYIVRAPMVVFSGSPSNIEDRPDRLVLGALEPSIANPCPIHWSRCRD